MASPIEPGRLDGTQVSRPISISGYITPTRGNEMSISEAMAKLIEAGAAYETKEDEHGDTRSGWWMDTVWLAQYSKPQDALQAIEG